MLVGLDVAVHLFGESSGPAWVIEWREKTGKCTWKTRHWTWRLPPFHDTVVLKSLFKTLSLVAFAFAILLEIGAYPYSERIDELADREFAGSQKQIGAALAAAGNANKEAARLRTQAEGFRLDISKSKERVAVAEAHSADASAKAESFRLDIAKANRAAAEANRTAEQERLERVKLEVRIADRHLTSAQQSRVAKSLCRFGGRNVAIGLYSPDGEMRKLSEDISGALPMQCDGRVGWAVAITPMQATEGFSGIQIVLKPEATLQDRIFASALVAALREEGLQVDGPMPSPNRGSIMSVEAVVDLPPLPRHQ